VDYASNKTGTNVYGDAIKTLISITNKEAPLPNAKCMADNAANPHYCLMAEHLVKYIETPLFIEQSLLDIWQIANILQIEQVNIDANINNLTAAELAQVQKFKDYTYSALKLALSYAPRTVWAPACPFHCWENYGDKTDPGSNYVNSPAESNNTLGEALFNFIYKGVRADLIDNVEWPHNKGCSFNGTSS
jgi:hypothetical protein